MLSRLIITPNPWRYNTEMIECISNPDIVPGNLDEENLVWGWGNAKCKASEYPLLIHPYGFAFMSSDDMHQAADKVSWTVPPTVFGSMPLDVAIQKCRTDFNVSLLIVDKDWNIIDEFV